MVFQTKVLEMLAPPNTTERTAYADWTKEMMINLHPSLWLKFQREFINKLYTYKEKSKELLYPVANQQLFSAPQLQFSVQHISAKPFPGRPPVLHRQTQYGNHLLSSGLQPSNSICLCGGRIILSGFRRKCRPTPDNNDDLWTDSIPLIIQSHYQHPYNLQINHLT